MSVITIIKRLWAKLGGHSGAVIAPGIEERLRVKSHAFQWSNTKAAINLPINDDDAIIQLLSKPKLDDIRSRLSEGRKIDAYMLYSLKQLLRISERHCNDRDWFESARCIIQQAEQLITDNPSSVRLTRYPQREIWLRESKLRVKRTRDFRGKLIHSHQKEIKHGTYA